MSKVIDLNCIKKEQERFSKYLETTKGIKYQEGNLKITEGQILALNSELYEVENEAKLHKEYDNEVDKNKVLEELSDCLSCIGNIANSLNMDLVINMETAKTKKIETQLLDLNEEILMLRYVVTRRRIKERIVPQFINIVFSLGFSLEELIEAYFKKMDSNYLNPKFM